MTEPSTKQADDSVITSVTNGVGRIELNKPKLINALSQDMVARIDEALNAWRDDDSVKLVLVTGRGERGLCAGGDIKAVYNDIVAAPMRMRNSGTRIQDELRDLGVPKPYVVVMNGITMGGGVGISGHGSSHRHRFDGSACLRPESGSSRRRRHPLLANGPGELGTHLALTGQPVGAGTAITLGIADYFVPDAQIPDLIADLTAGEDLESVLGKYPGEAPADDLAEAADWINACYVGDDAEAIVAALAAHENPDAKSTAELIKTKAPTSVKVTLAAIRNAEKMTLDEVLEQDYRVAVTLTGLPDLKEGIRAQVIDKDRNPQWNPASLAEVSDEQVHSILTTDQEDKVFS